jgi:hypothetical protein
MLPALRQLQPRVLPIYACEECTPHASLPLCNHSDQGARLFTINTNSQSKNQQVVLRAEQAT